MPFDPPFQYPEPGRQTPAGLCRPPVECCSPYEDKELPMPGAGEKSFGRASDGRSFFFLFAVCGFFWVFLGLPGISKVF